MALTTRLKKIVTGVTLAGALLVAAPHKAEAQRFGVGISIGGPVIAGPVYGGYYGPNPYYAYGPGYYPYGYAYPYPYGGYYGRGHGYGYGRGGYGYARGGYGGYGHGYRR